MMNLVQTLARAARPAIVAAALATLAPAAHAQTKPSAAELADANKLVQIIGATTLFNPLIPGVIEQAKLLFLQQNPALANDLNEVAAKLRADYAPRFSELTDQVAMQFATRFTEPELKQVLAFYSSPAGRKLLDQQPQIIDVSMHFAQDWANKLSAEVVIKIREEMKKKGHNL